MSSKNYKIVVTGANGQLGSELKEISEKNTNFTWYFFDINDFDLTDFYHTRKVFLELKPDFTINCAAYTAVDKAEDEYEKAFLVNSTVPENLVNIISEFQGTFIHISTDYVFDGRKTTPYDEDDITNPLSVYGKSKEEGEKRVLAYEKTLIIRTSWLYSKFGTNFVKTILNKTKEVDTLKVVFDQVGTPTNAADLANTILNIINDLINGNEKYGIFHFSNEGVCSWYDFAWEIVEYVKSNVKILPVLSTEYIQKACRPPYSVMNKKKIKEIYSIEIPYWKESLYKTLNLLLK